jgi:hypothetical protein
LQKKADGVMAPFVTMTWLTNKRWSLKDVPLSKYKNQLNLAESIEHTLLPGVSEETQNSFTSKRNSKQSLMMTRNNEEFKAEDADTAQTQSDAAIKQILMTVRLR